MKPPYLLKKIRLLFHSVFTKLLVLSLVTWFFILLSVIGVFLVVRHHNEGPFYKNAKLYVQYIINDIGSPPDRNIAMGLQQRTGLHISFSGESMSWTTRETFPQVEEVHFRSLHNNPDIQIGKRLGRHYLQVQTDDGIFFIEFSGAGEEEKYHQSAHLLLFVLISLVLIACFFTIKRILKPLKWLSSGVHEVTSGNLNHNVPIRGHDEFTELAVSFNEMTEKLKQMLNNKEHLLRDISHELRSPLTRMKIALELTSDKDLKKDIEEDVEEMEVMITSILESARDHHQSSRQELERKNLDVILRTVVEKYDKVPLGVKYLPSANETICNVDEASLSTVLCNCIDNGLKFSADQKWPLELHLSKARGRAIITITDHGEGVAQSELDNIFEPFYRIDTSRSRKTGGFGLGLSICKAIIDGHGGTISAESRKGEGTRITITLPLL